MIILQVENLNLETVAKAAIIEALVATRDNKTQAAKLLGIDRRTLYRSMNKHRIGKYANAFPEPYKGADNLPCKVTEVRVVDLDDF